MASSKYDHVGAMLKKGNAVYELLSESSCVFAAPVREGKLAVADMYYEGAIRCSQTAAERAVCFKERGLLYVMWAKFVLKDAMAEGVAADSSKLSCFKLKLEGAVCYLLTALHEGKSADKPEPWLVNLRGVLRDLVEWVVKQNRVLRLSSAPLLAWLSGSFDRVDENYVQCEAKVNAYLRLAEETYQQGILKSGDDEDEIRDFSGRLASIHECLQVLRKAKRFSGNCHGQPTANALLPEIEELEKRAECQMHVCESMQEIRRGDQMLKKASVDGKLNKEVVMDAIDNYLSARSKARGRDSEAEAIAMSRTGRAYSDVLKDPVKASRYHYKAIQLALECTSSRIRSSRWYKYSLAKHTEHQSQVVRDDERDQVRERDQVDQVRERATTKKRMEVELGKLDREAKKGARAFLLYIYQNHPSPDPEKRVPSDMLKGKGRTDKMLLKAARTHYHPDKSVNCRQEWQVLCEEIVKILNNMYEASKLAK